MTGAGTTGTPDTLGIGAAVGAGAALETGAWLEPGRPGDISTAASST